MALPVITLSTNFKGWAKIVANEFKEVDLDEYIDLYRTEYLRTILGAAAVIDITASSAQKWADLLDGTEYVDVYGKRQIFEGLVKPLVYFIYFEYVRDNFTSSQAGKVKGKSALSERATDIEVAEVARSRYNAGVRIVNTLGRFLEANETIQDTVSASTDNGNNTYVLALASTKYLSAGDTVTITGTNYVVTALVPDVNITIDAGQTGLDFTGVVVSWEPYADVEFKELKISGI